MTFIRKKTIIGFMVLLCFIASIASAEARAYPAAGSDAATFFEKTKGEDDSKLLYMCGFPCCGTNYHGPCSKCCPKEIRLTPEPAMNDDPLVPTEHMKAYPKLLYVCGYLCCGIDYRGPCNKCCPEGRPNPPESPMDDDRRVLTQSTNPVDDENVVYRCGNPCCGLYFPGECNRCCPL